MDTYQFHRCSVLKRHHEVSPTLDNYIFFIPLFINLSCFLGGRGREMITRSNIQANEIARFIWRVS